MGFMVRGEADANRVLLNLKANFQRAILGGGNEAVILITNRARQGMIEGPHSGRQYPRLPNQSSSAGEYAANQSGSMMGSIGGSNSLMRIAIWATAPHAGYVEFGTSKMGARPTVGGAIRDTEGQVEAIMGSWVWRMVS